MKNILFILVFAFGINAQAQITLEHIYDSAATYNYGTPATNSQLMIIKFELSGERYVKINNWGKVMDIYDMNHSLIKTISLAAMPDGGLGDIMYLSEQLFNTDSKIEFLYSSRTSGVTGIYNEDGTVLFFDTLEPMVRSLIPSQQFPIYNTSSGTKMLLSYRGTNLSTGLKARVYSLPGTLSTSIQEGNMQLMKAQGISNLYPNPSNGKITLQYELPKGEQEGEIILYNTQGAEVKRYKVDNTFSDLLLDNSQLQAGVYYYQLTTGRGSIGSKKMIVVK
jgi:hypothetical protein